MTKPRQFFHGDSASAPSARSPRTDVAIYRLRGADGNQIAIAVECVDGGGNVPRSATSLRQLAADVTTDFDKEVSAIVALAKTVISSLTALRPGELAIEFGVELGGEMGIPLVTRGEAKANFKITMNWKDTRGRD